MKPLFNPDDFPLKDTSKSFDYEVFCRTINGINDKKTLLDFMRIAITQRSGPGIDESFKSETFYREISGTDNLEILREMLRYFIRIDLYQKENAL
jgi:hypothetical protein